MQQQKLITAAAYAKSHGLNRSTVSRQIQQGKIPTVNGLVDPAEADQARQSNLSPARRLDAARRKRECKPAPTETEFATDLEAEIEYALLDRIRTRAAVILPMLARRLELPGYVVASASDVFDNVLAHVDADRDYFSPDGDGYQWPVVTPPGQKRPSVKVENAADAFYNRLDKLLDEIRTGAKPKKSSSAKRSTSSLTKRSK